MEPLLADPYNLELQEAIMPIMNTIGTIAGLVYLFYCFLMEASMYQATFGKKIMGLKVINDDGTPLSPKSALWRNAFKVFSHAVFSAGFFWILLDKQKRGWHDIMGKTFVVDRDYKSNFDIPEELIEQLEGIKDQPYRNTASTLSNANFNSLKEGNQTNLLYYPEMDLEEFNLIKISAPDPRFRLSKYTELLINSIIEKNSDIPGHLFWNNNTRGQKLLRVFTTFDQCLNTFSLSYFIFHHSEFTFTMIEVLEAIDEQELILDYRHVVREFEEHMDVFKAQRKTYEYQQSTYEDKAAAFDAFAAVIPLSNNIDGYYQEDSFQNDLYIKVCDYIESNPNMFIRTHS